MTGGVGGDELRNAGAAPCTTTRLRCWPASTTGRSGRSGGERLASRGSPSGGGTYRRVERWSIVITIERVLWDDPRAVALRARMDEEMHERYGSANADEDPAVTAERDVPCRWTRRA